MSSIQKVLVNSGIYGISNILIKGVNFFLLPLYTVYLTTQDYGILSVVNSYTYLFTIIFTFGLSRSTVRFYFIYRKNPDDVKKLWGTIITFIYTSALFFGIIFILFKSFLITPFIKNIDFFPYIFLGMMTVFLNPAFAVYQSTLPARHKAAKYGIQNISRATIRISITLLLVVVIELGVVGVLLSQVITAFVFLIYTFFAFRSEITLGFNKKMLKETLSYSVPLIPISLANWFYTTIDIIFLNNLKSTASAGIYNIGFQLGGILLLIIDSVHSAFKPFFYESMEEGESGKIKIINYAEAFVIFYAFAALSISFWGKDLLQLMVTKDFREGWIVIPFISFSFVFSGIQYFFYYPVEYSLKGAKYLNIPTFLSAGVNIVLNYLLIPIFGIIGAALTTLIAHIVSTSITLLISTKFVYIPYRWVKMYLITGVFFTFSLINYFSKYINVGLLLSIKIIIMGAILVYVSKSYKEEIIFLKTKLIKKQ
jgi:O-antigen/teichoic acid export membrane protein